MNIVVTGASGFIGRRLCKKLRLSDFNIKVISRETRASDFTHILSECDICFHLAGEVRPKATREDFFTSNVELTRKITESLAQNNKKTRVVFASTIHAQNPVNDYGFSKVEAERLISKYNADYGLSDFIFRLPHLFGEGAKPEHNSVFTTWIYNAVQGKELHVFDPEIVMTYVHVDELIDVFLKQIYNEYRLESPQPYIIKLGVLKDLILSINNGAACFSQLDFYILNMLKEAKSNL